LAGSRWDVPPPSYLGVSGGMTSLGGEADFFGNVRHMNDKGLKREFDAAQ